MQTKKAAEVSSGDQLNFPRNREPFGGFVVDAIA
jgi:hypothetical protein